MTPTREQLLAASYHFEAFANKMIGFERKAQWIMWLLVCWQVALTVWQFPVENWFQVAAVLLNIAGSVIGLNVIRRSRETLADMLEAREAARAHIRELGA